MKFAMISFAAAVSSVTAQHVVPLAPGGGCPAPAGNEAMYKVRDNGLECIKTAQDCGCKNGEGDADATCYWNNAGTAISNRCDRNKCKKDFFPVEMLKSNGESHDRKLYTCQTKCKCNRGEAKHVNMNEDGSTVQCDFSNNSGKFVAGYTHGRVMKRKNFNSGSAYIAACKQECAEDSTCAGFVDRPDKGMQRECYWKVAGYTELSNHNKKNFHEKGACTFENGVSFLKPTALATTVCHSANGQRCTSCDAGTSPDGTPKFILSPSASLLANGNTNFDQLYCQWQRVNAFSYSCRAGTALLRENNPPSRKRATTTNIADVQWCTACDDGSAPYEAHDWTAAKPRMICDSSVPCSCTDIEGKEIGMVDTKHMDQCWRMGSQSCLACDETYSLYQMANGRYMCGWNEEFGSSAAMMKVEAESTGTLLMVDDKCNHSDCMEWTCKEWCQCYQEAFDGVYEQEGCNVDDGTVCKCPRWSEEIPEHEDCTSINLSENAVERRELCEHITNPHCAWREADQSCAATAVAAKPDAPARCERWCKNSKACGNGCINKNYVCGGRRNPTPEREGASNPGKACDTFMYNRID